MALNGITRQKDAFIIDIDKLLFERFLGKKQRNASKGKKRMGHIPKRTLDDDLAFERGFRKLLEG